MKRLLLLFFGGLFASLAVAQSDGRGGTDEASVAVGRARATAAIAAPLPHPFHVEARHWPEGCEEARGIYVDTGLMPDGLAGLDGAPCGERFMEDDGENLITGAGVDLFSDLMFKTSSPPAQCNYVALTNTAITPSTSDTSLSGEITTNGLARSQSNYSRTGDAALGTAPTPGSLAMAGTAGSTTQYYWVFDCTYQGCSAAGSSANITTVNATLSTTNYVTGSFTGKIGAAYYVVVRTGATSTAPSGALAGGSANTSSGQISAGYVTCENANIGNLTAGAAPACYFADMSNTTNAFIVPAADQTYAGKNTLSYTFTATAAQSAQAFGILNASSSGTLCLEGTFSSASLQANDTLTFTETVYH